MGFEAMIGHFVRIAGTIDSNLQWRISIWLRRECTV